MGVALGEREKDISILENSNSELRKQAIAAINNQELTVKELLAEKKKGELRIRER